MNKCTFVHNLWLIEDRQLQLILFWSFGKLNKKYNNSMDHHNYKKYIHFILYSKFIAI